MTYTILGACPDTGRLGLAMATSSLGVGGRCPAGRSGVGVASSQSFTNPRHSRVALDLLEQGTAIDDVLALLESDDEHFPYRQVAVVSAAADVVVHTGGDTAPWSGHETGEGWCAMGNILTGPQVVEAIASAFVETLGKDLEERLLAALEAGRDAGGESVELPERSSALMIWDDDIYPVVDVRVDVSGDAVSDLRASYEAMAPYVPLYSHLRPARPDLVPTEAEWIREHAARPSGG